MKPVSPINLYRLFTRTVVATGSCYVLVRGEDPTVLLLRCTCSTCKPGSVLIGSLKGYNRGREKHTEGVMMMSVSENMYTSLQVCVSLFSHFRALH